MRVSFLSQYSLLRYFVTFALLAMREEGIPAALRIGAVAASVMSLTNWERFVLSPAMVFTATAFSASALVVERNRTMLLAVRSGLLRMLIN
jgi:hypothetical protein